MGDAALMARPRSPSRSISATPVRQPNRKLIEQVLSDPTLYPDEMKAWMPRFLSTNVNMKLTEEQLPTPGANQVVGGTGAPVFQNGWTNFGAAPSEPALYYSDTFRRVYLGGLVASGTINTPIFTLPSGMRPAYAKVFAVLSNGLLGRCDVNPDGTVVAVSGSNLWFSLSGISFRENG